MRVLPALLVLPVLTIGPARGAAAVQCVWASDATNDATGFLDGVPLPVSDSSMDVEKVILATDATRVTLWLKMYALASSDQYAPTGRRFTLGFTVHTGGKDVAKDVHVYLNQLGVTSADAGAQVRMDYTGFEIHVTMPLSRLGLAKLQAVRRRPPAPADVFNQVRVSVERWRGEGASGTSVGVAADTLTAPYAYPHRASSCVKVGT